MKIMQSRLDTAKQYIEDCCIPITETGCWIWNRRNTRQRTNLSELPLFAAELAYTVYKGPIPEDQAVVHKCGVVCCVNPEHLELKRRHTTH